MPGRKKRTSRVLILLTVLLSLFFSATLTQSSANPTAVSSEKQMPDIIVAENTQEKSQTAELTDSGLTDGDFQGEANTDDPAKKDEETFQNSQNTAKDADESSAEEPEEEPIGDWILDNGSWYYQIHDYYKTGWLYEDDKWYYFDKTGVMQTGWVESQKRWFFMDEDGIMQTGWVQTGGKWYHMDEEGIMQTGWLEVDGQWYYLSDKGDMRTGWIQIGDKWYYFNSNGTMATGWIVANGKRYFLQDNGVWDPAAVPDAASIPEAPEGAMVALTYDDGPGLYTDRLLDTLEANNAKATFFMLGENIPNYPSTIQRMEALGCELGNHTANHKDLAALTQEEITAQVGQVDQALTDIVGHGSTLVRPPYGSANDLVKSTVQVPLILWSMDTLDWKTLDIPSTVDTVFTNIKDGDIILMHDIHETSVAASEIIIPALVEKGYQLVTVSELAAAKGIEMHTGILYGNMGQN